MVEPMDKTTGWMLISVTALAIAAKLAWLGYIYLFKPDEIPKDISGPVSGWGTPDD